MLALLKNKKFRTDKLLSIKDLTEISLTKNLDIKKKYRILVIDDQGFQQADSLDKMGYKDITIKYDFDDINDILPYDIIFCDINGIGIKIDEKGQGASVARIIKDTFPQKIVIIFSAAEQPLSIVDNYNFVDDVITKNMSAKEMSSNIDRYIQTLENPILRWPIIKKMLEQKNIQTKDIAILENYYVKTVLNGNDYSKELEQHLAYNNQNKLSAILRNIIPIFCSILVEVAKNYVSK